MSYKRIIERNVKGSSTSNNELKNLVAQVRFEPTGGQHEGQRASNPKNIYTTGQN